MTDPRATVIIDGDVGPLRKKLREGLDDIQGFQSRVSATFGGLRDTIGNLGNIMATLGAIRMVQLVDDATLVTARLKDVTGSAEGAAEAKQRLMASAQRLQVGYTDLAGSVAKMLPALQAMGGGTNEAIKLAEILATTAKLSGASTQEAASAQTQFAQALASGVLQGDELKSILENNSALARVMAEGLGVGVGELKRLGTEGKLTADVVANALMGQYDTLKAKSDELPQTVGGAWIKVTNSFQGFVEALNDGTGAFNVVGALLSGLSKLIDAVKSMLSGTGSEADKLGRNKSVASWGETVGAVFAYVIDLGRSVWQTIEMVGQAIGGLAAATVTALSGDLAGASNILTATWNDLKGKSAQIGELITGGAGSTLQAYALGAGGGNSSAPDGPSKKMVSKVKPKDDDKSKDKADPSDMPAIQAQLEARKLQFMQEHNLREMNKLEEVKTLEEIGKKFDLNAKDKIHFAKQVAAAEIAALKEMAEQGRQLADGERKSREDRALAAVQAAQQEARQQLELGNITKAESLALEQQFEAQRNEIRMQALRERLTQTDPNRDPVAYAQVLAEIEQLETQHELRMGQLRQQSLVESRQGMMQFTQGLEGGFARVFSQVGTTINSIGGLFKGMFQVVLQTFVQMLAQMAAKWLINKVLMKAISKTTALGEIVTEAGKAGAGGVASMAAAPFPLNLGAPAFGASMSALAMGFLPMASAAGGYDIPAGINPLTQLHAEEMVLPKHLANPLRNMLSQDGQQAAGEASNSVVYNDHSGSLSDAEIERKAHVIANVLNRAHRNGWRPK
jgi:tape measure domain-containing protein